VTPGAGLTWLLPLLPAVAAVLVVLVGGAARRGPRGRLPAALLAVAGTAAATVVAVAVALDVLAEPATQREAAVAFAPTGGPDIVLGTLVDGLASTVAVMVCVVALLVQVYSISYLKGTPRYPSYAAAVSLFTAAMLLVVVSADLLVLYVGWEVMGLCSYLLVGHHWEQSAARAGAVKAFLVTRLGDVAFLFGIFVLGEAAGSFRITAVIEAVPRLDPGTVTIAALLLLGGVAGKSAQFPLHVWLPDAMAGPTPVSALIHAATMVAAGVYVVARLYPVFLAAPIALAVLGALAAVTMLGAALAALAQDDLKRVLAWSTVSQLAYMTAGLAVGGYTAAVAHLLSHAAFKALLFLGAGALIHVVGSNLMSDMGGLRRALPTAFVTTTIGLAALVGLPPTAGFFTKEAVLGAAEHAALGEAAVTAWVGWAVLLSALATVAVTAAYATRVWLRTFFGSPVSAPGHGTPVLMAVPLLVLAVPALLFGFTGLSADLLPTWIGTGASGAGDASSPEALLPAVVTAVLSMLLAAAGGYAAYRVWRDGQGADPATALGRFRRPFQEAFGLDAAYDRAVVRPLRALSLVARRTDDDVVDAAVVGSGRAARALGGALRRTQAGNAQGYLTGVLAGVVALAVAVVMLS
jgi:NADH-quinone oxidoreductase subunit L